MALQPVRKGKGKVSAGTLEKASWTFKANETFVRLCAEEVLKGNRPQTHLTPIGWANIEKAFCEETKREWSHQQLKNRWDVLKKEWTLWNALVGKETGLGVDHSRGTIDASNEWWDEKIKVRPDVAKFREKGLAHIDKLEIMFRDAYATGEYAWAPNSSSGTMPIEEEDENEEDEVQTLDGDESNTSESSRKRTSSERSGSQVMGTSLQRKRPQRTSVASRLEKAINRMVNAIESSNVSSNSIDEVLRIIETLPGVTKSSPLYLFATTLFMKNSARDMFIGLPEDVRLTWLQHQYDLARGVKRA